MKLCSACLLGLHCRYDGKGMPDEKVKEMGEQEILIPLCPEQLGGLPTPRPPAEIRDGRVMTEDGRDVTEVFIRGAREVLELARMYGIREAVLKQNSPSCGCGRVYDGTFSGRLIDGEGITSKLLKENGILVISEEDL